MIFATKKKKNNNLRFFFFLKILSSSYLPYLLLNFILFHFILISFDFNFFFFFFKGYKLFNTITMSFVTDFQNKASVHLKKVDTVCIKIFASYHTVVHTNGILNYSSGTKILAVIVFFFFHLVLFYTANHD